MTIKSSQSGAVFKSIAKFEPKLALICTIILVCFFLVKMQLTQEQFAANDWLAGDWLINYSAGFVRRGLLGEAALQISNIMRADLLSLIVDIKMLFYGIFSFCLLLLCYRKSIGILELFLLAAPWAIPFGINSPLGSGRKEIAIFAAMAAYACLKNFSSPINKPVLKRWSFWFLLMMFLILTLMHEGLFFFFQFFLLHTILDRGKPSKSDIMEFTIPYLLASFLMIIFVIFFKGDQDYASKICSSITAKGIESSICGGAIQSLAGFHFEAHEGYWRTYAPSFGLTFIGLGCYLCSVFERTPRAQLLCVCLLALLPTIPLYILGADWGRWIHISGLLMFIVIFSTKQVSRPPWKLSTPILVFFIILNPWFYVYQWIMPHWIGNNVAAGFIWR